MLIHVKSSIDVDLQIIIIKILWIEDLAIIIIPIRSPLSGGTTLMDIFAIWSHGEEALMTFVEEINKTHSTINFTAECPFPWYSRFQIVSLSLTLLCPWGMKPSPLTSMWNSLTHIYLAANSYHSLPCKEAISFSQLQAFQMGHISSDFQRGTEVTSLLP